VRTLADRYRLEDCVLDGPHWSYWRGYDGVLRRAVGILVLVPDHELGTLETDVLAAARASAGAEDARVLRVLDVLSDDEGTCLVIEWLTAQSLEELLADGPLPDVEAWRVTLEVAQALASAQAQGLGHGALAPHWVLRGEDGRVRLLGLGFVAALAEPVGRTVTSGSAGTPAPAGPDGPATDAAGLGALLYAALTGRWPGAPGRSALAPAPQQSGHAVRPRMVRAGVPAALDDVAARALGLPGRGEPLRSPAAVAAALELAGERMKGFDRGEPADGSDGPDGSDGERRTRRAGDDRRRRRPRSVPLVAAAAVLAVLAVPSYLGVRSLGASKGTGTTSPTGTALTQPTPTASGSQPPLGISIPIVSARDFDPAGNGSENPAQAPLAIDGDLTTAWHTVTYFKRANLGGLKPGVGLLLDLGREQRVATVSVHLVGLSTSLQLLASKTLSAAFDDYLPLARVDDAGSFATLRPAAPATARYLLIWLTSLPPAGNNFQGGIFEVEVTRS
jgi:hypothetical protein